MWGSRNIARVARFLPLPVDALVFPVVVASLALILFEESWVTAAAYGCVVTFARFFGSLARAINFSERPRASGTAKRADPDSKLDTVEETKNTPQAAVENLDSATSKKRAWVELQRLLDNPPPQPSARKFLQPSEANRVGFVVSVAQVGDQLEALVRSILCQSSPNWDIVVVVTRANDKRLESVRDITGREDARIQVTGVSSANHAEALEKGLELVSAPYVSFLRVGDELFYSCVPDILLNFEQTGAESGIFRFLQRSKDGREFQEVFSAAPHNPWHSLIFGLDLRRPDYDLLEQTVPTFTGKVFRTELVRRTGISSFAEPNLDFEFLASYSWLASSQRVWTSSRSLFSVSCRDSFARPTTAEDIFQNLSQLSERLTALGAGSPGRGFYESVLTHWIDGDETPESLRGLDVASAMGAWPALIGSDVDAPLLKRSARSPAGKVPPELSIVIPVRGRLSLFEALLESIQPQIKPGVEVVVVIDPLDKDSAPEINRLLARTPQSNMFVGNATGAGPGRNFGAQQARGKFLWFVDSDDILPREAIPTVLTRIKNANWDVGLFNAEHFTHPDGVPEVPAWFLKMSGLEESRVYLRSELQDRLFQLTTPAPWNLIIRKEFFTRNHLEFSSLPSSNDVVAVLIGLACATHIALFREVIYRYRRYAPGGIQGRGSPLSLLRSIRQLKSELRKRGLLEDLESTYRRFVHAVLIRGGAGNLALFRWTTLLLLFPDLLEDVSLIHSKSNLTGPRAI